MTEASSSRRKSAATLPSASPGAMSRIAMKAAIRLSAICRPRLASSTKIRHQRRQPQVPGDVGGAAAHRGVGVLERLS